MVAEYNNMLKLETMPNHVGFQTLLSLSHYINMFCFWPPTKFMCCIIGENVKSIPAHMNTNNCLGH